MDNRPIGLFDSGVGGLSILEEIRKTLPKENFVFLADQLNVPYGAKTAKQLKLLVHEITKFLLKYDIKLMVVACNTASCYTIDFLRKRFTIPIVGVVPAIKPAVEISKSGKIAVMSTPATAKSKYLDNLVKKLAPKNQVLRVGCEGLEEAVEQLKFPKISRLLKKYLEIIDQFEADVIVLGCTHYPFLKKDIEKMTGGNTSIIDSGKAVASRVKSVLKKSKIQSYSSLTDLFYTTGDPQEFSKVASTLLKYKIVGKKVYI